MSSAVDEAPVDRSLIERFQSVAASCRSDDLALRSMRMYIHLVSDRICKFTVDCTGPSPRIDAGHFGPAHAAARVAEHAFPAFFSAYSFEKVLHLFQDGSIRLIQGTCLRLMFSLRERALDRTHPELRAAIQDALNVEAPQRQL